MDAAPAGAGEICPKLLNTKTDKAVLGKKGHIKKENYLLAGKILARKSDFSLMHAKRQKFGTK